MYSITRYRAAGASVLRRWHKRRGLAAPVFAVIATTACAQTAATSPAMTMIPADQWRPVAFHDYDYFSSASGDKVLLENWSGKAMTAFVKPIVMVKSGLFTGHVDWRYGHDNWAEDPRLCGPGYNKNGVSQSRDHFPVKAGDTVIMGFTCAASDHPLPREEGEPVRHARFYVLITSASYAVER